MSDKKDTFVSVSNSRPGVYEEVIKKIVEDKVCPFCAEQLTKYHKNPILLEKKYWLATDNMYPYKGAKTHLLFIHKKHISHLNEMSKEAEIELHEMVSEFIKSKNIPGGTLLMRFGDTRYTGASVNHLHTHLISSNPDNAEYAPLLARVG